MDHRSLHRQLKAWILVFVLAVREWIHLKEMGVVLAAPA